MSSYYLYFFDKESDESFVKFINFRNILILGEAHVSFNNESDQFIISLETDEEIIEIDFVSYEKQNKWLTLLIQFKDVLIYDGKHKLWISGPVFLCPSISFFYPNMPISDPFMRINGFLCREVIVAD